MTPHTDINGDLYFEVPYWTLHAFAGWVCETLRFSLGIDRASLDKPQFVTASRMAGGIYRSGGD